MFVDTLFVEIRNLNPSPEFGRTGAVVVVPSKSQVRVPGGWREVADLRVGERLAHPAGADNHVAHVVAVGPRMVMTVRLADGLTFCATPDTTLLVRVGAGDPRRPVLLTVADAVALVEQGTRVQVVPIQPLEGIADDLPLDAWLCGAAIGDGYLRRNSTEIINEEVEMHAMLRAALPPGATLSGPRVGLRSTTVSIVGENGVNPVTAALRDLGLAGCRAWEKHIPSPYMQASPADQLRLVQGLFDTDATVDALGRVEFSTSSPQLAADVQEVVNNLGGRATLTVKTNVKYTSPAQLVPKPARDAHRLLNVRLPDGMSPFRLSRKVARLRERKFARQWSIRGVDSISVEPCVEVIVTATDGAVITDGFVPLMASTGASGLLVAA